MRRFFPPKNTLNCDQSANMDKNYRRHQLFRTKSSSPPCVKPRPSTQISDPKPSARIVRIRLVFIRIGDIDTLNERYQADVYFEARWTEVVPIASLGLEPEQNSQLLNENGTVRQEDGNKIKCWAPQLFIENATGQPGEQNIWFTITRKTTDKFEVASPLAVHVEICEHRRIRGMFWEKLELNHFPADVQDLTVSITTHCYVEHCRLIQDPLLRSSINREAFVDQQEWNLYEHVATESRETQEEYSFVDNNSGIEQKKHSVLAVTCRAARRPGYYYWNGFCLIFLITICAFCIFSIPPDLPQSRLQITCTLLLTSITFRWVVNRSLPTISYLTTLDKYAIISIMFLVLLCVWHSIIASIIFLNPEVANLKAVAPTNVYVYVDRYVCIAAFLCYILIHVILIIWLICVPYKRRREMEYLDREYATKKHIVVQMTPKRHKSIEPDSEDLAYIRTSAMHGNLPLRQPCVRPKKSSDGVAIIGNSPAFLPIQEEGNESSGKSMTATEMLEHDEVFYDHTNGINGELKSTQMQPVKHL